ncbi:MAG: sigma-54-dependent Fis family transcriptional regulator, partial [Myxococcales bacterium]|nr:sigma-54-dependent Fis family transcriptional regulator [Myxococcales bacterium]
ERVALTEPTLAPPGACVAIDDRLLLGLELHARHRGPEAERMGLVGEDPAIWRLRDEIGEIGEFRKPVLILGETGTGKELIAGALHRYGRASAGPYQTLNCAALPDQLVESLLFGHAKGAFTGASGPQEGVFRAADGGTLFLDELGEMPTSIQPKLLRTLQDGVVTALGQHRGVKVDVRLVAATNRDPEQEIAAGRLRADLYHRVAAHVIRVPTLASRPFDVPALFVHFLARSREEHPALEWLWSGPERWRATAPMSFFTALMAYPWPGNIRELENISERTARMNLRGKPFSSPALDGPSRAEPAQPRAPVVADAPTRKRAGDHAERARAASRVLGIAAKTVAKLLDVEALAAVWAEVDPADEAALSDRLEREAKERLYACLIEQEFAQGPVARRLGVSPWTLIRLMQRFGLARPTELTHEQIERALVDADGDLARAARSLEVSEHGLKQRLAALERSR